MKAKKLEILSPAGNMEALKAAIAAGANAIYLGGKKFGARAFANNFDHDELLEAVNYAHLNGVKIYVTVNTLIYDEEMKAVMNYVDELYHLQVDAILIQDLGLMNLVHQKYPDFDIHASTQASIHNLNGVLALKDFGVKRVVLARECSIEQIKYICENTDLEIEVFVHGALCMSYSGQCLMSSLIGGRSGNRGTCAQPCRKPYNLIKDGEIISSSTYLLSTKDICTIDHIDELIEAGVTSFKIEGRMKREEYVYTTVSLYKQAIVSYLKNQKVEYNQEEMDDLNQLFTRGYSKGYAFHENKISQTSFPGHLGKKIGKVTGSTRKTVSVQLTDTLHQNDGIRFGKSDLGRIINKMYIKDALVNKGEKGDIVEIEFNQAIKKNTDVYLTTDASLIHKIDTKLSIKPHPVAINMHVSGKIGEPLILRISDGKHTLKAKSTELISEPINQPVTKERIEQQLSKLGNTVYKVHRITFDLPDSMYISMKALNALRQAVTGKLDELRQEKIHTGKKQNINIQLPNTSKKMDRHYVYVSNLNQLEIVLDYNHVDMIIYPYNSTSLAALETCEEYEMPFCLAIGRIHTDAQLEEIYESEIYQCVDTLLVGDLASYYYFGDKEVILDSSMNLTNSYSVNTFSDETILSVELTENQINELKTDREIGVYLYGRNEVMISEYCPISNHYLKYKKEKCNLCKTGHFVLEDMHHGRFPIRMDDHCRMHLLSHLILKYTYFKNLKVNFSVIHFTDESQEEVALIMNDYTNIFDGLPFKEELVKSKYTLGYFKK